ncbi:GNAT family N-acetyltransferase [Pelagibius sp.]|uniref:GNAT family N-acetyltransferase n=1 Tax=Pelagibius sp. TaxID=1931238 RepID=UPI003BAEF9BC
MKNTNSIRPARPGDRAALMALAEATGLFQAPELEDFEAMVSAAFAGDLGEDHLWIVDEDQDKSGGSGGLRAAAYYAPEMMADAVWNLYFIGVYPDCQGQGRGTALLRHVEDELRAKGQRLLLIETSGLDSFAQTRAFYRKNGYDEEARLRDFYCAGEDKVIFRKAL